jgi:hypothetical protein
LDNDKIELIFDSNSEATEENSDETGKEEDDVTEQAPILSHREVCKLNLVMLAGGVHNNTDDTSDDEVIPTPPAPQGVLKWGQVTGRTNSNIHPFTSDMAGKKQNVAPHINKDLTPYNVSVLYFGETSYLACGKLQ